MIVLNTILLLYNWVRLGVQLNINYFLSRKHSRKSKSKTERKKYSLREGSKHEDFALREALAEIILKTDKMKGKKSVTILSRQRMLALNNGRVQKPIKTFAF